MTRSYATMEVSPYVFDEIAAKLEAAGYDHAIIFRPDDKIHLDMHGIALAKGPPLEEIHYRADGSVEPPTTRPEDYSKAIRKGFE